MNKININTNNIDTKQSITSQAAKYPRPSDIRLRAFIVGLLIIPANNYWVLMMEKVRTGPYPSTISIFANVVFVLVLLVILNTLLKRINPKLMFSTAEMLIIYTMVAIATSLASHDLVPNLVATMSYPWHFDNPQYGWSQTFLPYLPKWLSVSNAAVLKPLYEGDSSLYTNGYWLVWLKPALFWLAFVVVLVFVMMCINTLVRKQWTEHERLTFPIVQLPIAMTEPKGEIWRNKLFWTAFSISFGICLLNGFSVYFPSIPRINLSVDNHDLALGLTSRPWSAIGWTPYSFYPFAIGLGYLLPTDLSFSCWFFYLLWKVQLVISSIMGWDTIPNFPYVRNQSFGGYIAIISMLTWSSRGYLKQVWLRVKKEESTLDDSDEPMSYRTAVIGALIGFLFLCAFMMKIGMSPLVAIIAFLIYFLLAIAITRMRAELGPPVHDLHFSGPDFVIPTTGGLGRLSNGDMIGLTYFFWFNRAYRAHPMPIGIEGMKMAQTTKSSQRKFMIAIMLATVVGAIATFWAYLHLGYRLGVTAQWHYGPAFADGAFHRNISVWWNRPKELMGPDWGANIATIGGFAFCMFLGSMRLRMLGFPFHPIGYAISNTYQINLVWVPLMIAWIIKVTFLKFGGLKVYKTAIPFFLGLIVGEMVMGCIWGLIGITFNIPYFNFWGA